MNLSQVLRFSAATVVALAIMAGPSQAAKLDRSFGQNGVSIVGKGFPRQGARGLTIDSSGRLLVTGRGGDSGKQIYVGRVLGNGGPDPSFGTNGYALYDGSASVGSEYGVSGLDPLVRRDGKITVAGIELRGPGAGDANGLLAGFNSDGSIDSTWGFDGLIVNDYLDEANAVVQDWRGRLVVVGDSGYGDVMRYTPAGKLDKGLVGDLRNRSDRRGWVQIKEGRRLSVLLTDVVSLGKRGILVAGVSSGRFLVAKLNNRGGYDNTFGDHGIAMVDVEPGKNYPYNRSCANCTAMGAMALTKDGRIILVGSSPYGRLQDDQRLILMRFTRNGHLDRSFAKNGVKVIRQGYQAASEDVAIQRDGKIVTVGGDWQGCAIMRFTPNGSLDRTFFKHGKREQPSVRCPHSVLIDRAGRIVTAGGDLSLQYLPEYKTSFIMRILPNAR